MFQSPRYSIPSTEKLRDGGGESEGTASVKQQIGAYDDEKAIQTATKSPSTYSIEQDQGEHVDDEAELPRNASFLSALSNVVCIVI
ncbi:hypothetical protein EV182_006948, partial [Spiromyces aspiralis]